ncbi:MAG TPA: LacI family DNA-binding transcriptional regulator [Solirubrobacteraceae bacterium]|nr:LacI family DNA-binding transcriptional regulator [Solirubrobacteraceae bacterium]
MSDDEVAGHGGAGNAQGREARRHPTMEDVAAAAGVSRALVSLVFRDQPNVSAERRARVLKAAAALGYRPNAMARSLASRRTRTVGAIIDDLRNPFFAEVVGGIEEFASELGYRLLLAAGGRSGQRERSALEALLEYRVDGIILVSPRVPINEIVAAGDQLPLVMVSQALRGLDAVITDDRGGVEQVIDHLVALGHRDIVHIDGGPAPGGRQRAAAFRRGMKRRGLKSEIIPGDFVEEAGVRGARELIDRGGELPTAVFAANDLVAVGVLGVFAQEGVSVPGQVSIVGYDNVSIARLEHVSLTTIDQPRVAMGREALGLLLSRINGRQEPVTVTLAPELVVRSTTAPPRG